MPIGKDARSVADLVLSGATRLIEGLTGAGYTNKYLYGRIKEVYKHVNMQTVVALRALTEGQSRAAREIQSAPPDTTLGSVQPPVTPGTAGEVDIIWRVELAAIGDRPARSFIERVAHTADQTYAQAFSQALQHVASLVSTWDTPTMTEQEALRRIISITPENMRT